ncbi:MAG: prolyl oligopeptidase family serine peptidase [Flavobacteriia bacterium]|jgi:dipeptidyl aminopeptidase/acylaminoacyl peptidase
MKVLSSILFVALSLTTFSQGVLTPELLWKLRRLSGGTVSPDGSMVLFSQRVFSMDENKGNTDLFVLDVKTSRITQITQTSFSEIEAQWGINNSIWYMSTEKDGLQIWKIKADGSSKFQCSNFKGIELEGFKVAPNESSVITIEAVKMIPTVQEKYPDLPKANARVEDDLMYRHWDHFDDHMRRHLFVHYVKTENSNTRVDARGVDILNGEIYDGILPPFGGSDQFCYSNDSKKIIYTSKKLQGKEFALSTNSELYEYSIDNRKTRILTEGNKGYDNNPAYSSLDQLAWLSMARDGFEADKNCLKVMGKDGKIVDLTAGMDITVGSFCWHPSGKMIYFIAPVNGTEQIFETDIATGKIRQITNGQFDYVSLSIFGDNIFAGRQSMVEPTDLYSVGIKKGKVTRLTNVNEDLLKGISIPKVEERWVETTDGKKMLVWMVLPPNFDAAKKYPALLYCQGGPQSQVSQFFSYRWNLSVMASQGYVIVAPNRRGLPGFGQEWNDAISRDWGGQAMRDYLSAIDNAAKEPYVDETRLGAVGASYGGYSVYMLAGIHENRFKTFISHCGLFNLESWYGTTEELFFANWDHGGPYWLEANKENYKKNSPHNYVANWNTPILVIHGGIDFRVPESEGMQAFQAAQLKGIKSRYLYFPAEGHWVQSPQNGLLWQREFFEWLAEDLRP